MPSATERVARLRLELKHMSIRDLKLKGVVEVDESDHAVREGPQFNDRWKAVFE